MTQIDDELKAGGKSNPVDLEDSDNDSTVPLHIQQALDEEERLEEEERLARVLEEESLERTLEEKSSEAGDTTPNRKMKLNLSAGDMIGVGFDQINRIPVTCIKCKYPIAEPFKARKFGKQGDDPTFVCRLCGNILTMVYRKLDIHSLDEAGLELSFLKGREVDSFFAQAHAAIGPDETLEWGTLRECLIQHFVTRKVSKSSVVIDQRQLPLSVWATQGFDVEAIKKGGRCFPHPDFGEVWTTPLKTISHEQVTRSYLIPLVALIGSHICLPPLNSQWLTLISPPRSSCTISP